MNYKKWLVSSLALILCLLTLLSLTVYIIDPFFQFRIKDNSYMLKARYVSPGLIKNYDYDTLIIGSSMTQNFDMDIFREELNVRPLHIGLGGLRGSEMIELMELAYKSGKADKYYICADMYLFTSDIVGSRIPAYLLDNGFLSKCRYFLNYETWFRYIPIDIGFMIFDKLGVGQSEKTKFSKSIDRLEDWSLDYKFGDDIVLKNYRSGKYAVSDIEIENLYNKTVARIDNYFNTLQLDKGEHIFFFAPYSMLYWADKSEEVVDVLLDCQKYFNDKAIERGLIVYDFQTADFTTDLNNYKDTTHYSSEINDWMTRKFKEDEYIVTKENQGNFKNKLLDMRNEFIEKHSYLF